METKKTLFESITCSRCAGSGKYSYCQMYGDTCFKCHGRGIVLTKRGQAAQDFYTTLLSKTTLELKAGDKVLSPDMFGGSNWKTVTEVYKCTAERTGGSWSLAPTGEPVYYGYCVEGICNGVEESKVWRVSATKEQKVAAQEKALAYQETLTKAGTIRKAAKK